MSLPPGGLDRLAALARTFLGEAAVLVLVFPVLDRFVAFGAKGITPNLIAWSFTASLFLFAIAATIAIFLETGTDAD